MPTFDAQPNDHLSTPPATAEGALLGPSAPEIASNPQTSALHADPRTGLAADVAGETLDFRVLGPLEVRRGERPVRLSSAKHRVLLAALLLRAGEVLPFGELTELIWGDRPPEQPRRAIQLYVTRLRKLLRVPGVIVTYPDGYRLDVPALQIDLGRFRLCLEQADRAVGDPMARAEALARALAEWRGEPLAGLPSDALQSTCAPQLQELRSRTRERLFDVELSLGRAPELIDALSALTAQYPLRERLWAQLMTALHRSGRRGDALSAYHVVRRNLADELGIEPGEPLQALYAEVLAGQSPGASPSIPRQLPPDLPVFVGRTEALARLDALHAEDTRAAITVISGIAGVGKTALAARWAHRVAEDFPDGQLWADLRGSHPHGEVRPEDVLARFLRALGVLEVDIPLDPDDRASLYRSLTDGRRMLVVLDDASSAYQVRPLQPGAPDCATLVTSQRWLPDLIVSQGAHPLVLDVLTPEEARSLLIRRLGTDRVPTDGRTAKVIDACGGLPLALATLAARATAQPEAALDALTEALPALLKVAR